jgi:tRNA threonylcarbamoyl adenosine modification protein (Sua5/YciO/YrdC/YwlC family)
VTGELAAINLLALLREIERRTMTQHLKIHPENPQKRLLQHAVDSLREGGVVAYPTDSCYALGCLMGSRDAMDRIRQLRGNPKEHFFTLVCRDLSEISTYARVDNAAYRFLKSNTPGAYTFILPASREVPKRLQEGKRRTIGIRVPQHAVALALLELLGEPIMSTTLQLPDEDAPMSDPEDIADQLDKRVDVVVDGGNCGFQPSTVVDLSEDPPSIIRSGKAPVSGTM